MIMSKHSLSQTIEKSIPLGADLKSVEFRQLLLEVIQGVLGPAWADVKVADLDVDSVDSSLTNQLCIVRSNGKAKKEDSVIVRIFGANTGKIIDRESERCLNESLTQIGFDCPAFLGYFHNGRIESFINGKSCNDEDFASPIQGPAIANSLAPLLGKLHSVVTSRISFANEQTISKSLEFISIADKVTFPDEHEKAIKLHSLNFSVIKAKFHEVVQEIDTIKKERGDLPVHIIATQNTIIHGDLLCGNILIDNSTPLVSVTSQTTQDVDLKLWLIDMEYSGVGSPAYDIANHFNEWLGYNVDNSLYPSKNVRYTFYQKYLDARAAHANSSNADYQGVLSKKLWESWTVIRENSDSVQERDRFLSIFDEIVVLFGLLSHLYWSIWAITRAVNDETIFDYLDYAKLKFKACLELEKVWRALKL